MISTSFAPPDHQYRSTISSGFILIISDMMLLREVWDVFTGLDAVRRDSIQTSQKRAILAAVRKCSPYDQISKDFSSDDASLEAQSSGKSPSLCASNSTFSTDLEPCKSCIVKYSTSTTSSTSPEWLSSFNRLLNFCEGQDTGSKNNTVIADVSKVVSLLEEKSSVDAQPSVRIHG